MLSDNGKSRIAAIVTCIAACAATVASVLLSEYIDVGSFSLHPAIYTTVTGVTAVYSLCFVAVLILLNLFKPSRVLFEDMKSNRWYYLIRMGVPSAAMASCALRKRLFAPLLAYLCGAGVVFGAGALLGLEPDTKGYAALLCFGLVTVFLTLSVFVFIGVRCRRPAVAFVLIALYTAFLAFVLIKLGLCDFSAHSNMLSGYIRQMRLSGVTYLSVTAIVSILMLVTYYFAARDYCAFYHPVDIKNTQLDRMGISKNMSVHEGKKMLAQGKEIPSKSDFRKQTVAIAINTQKAETAHASRHTQVGFVVSSKEDEGLYKKKSAVSIVLILLAAFVMLLSAAVGLAVKSISPDNPISMFGVTVIEAAVPMKNTRVGELALFKYTDSIEDKSVLYRKSDGYGFSAVKETDWGSVTLANGDTCDVGDIMGEYSGGNQLIEQAHRLLSGPVGMAIILALILGALLVLFLGIFWKKKVKHSKS